MEVCSATIDASSSTSDAPASAIGAARGAATGDGGPTAATSGTAAGGTAADGAEIGGAATDGAAANGAATDGAEIGGAATDGAAANGAAANGAATDGAAADGAEIGGAAADGAAADGAAAGEAAAGAAGARGAASDGRGAGSGARDAAPDAGSERVASGTRERILDATLRVVADEGIGGVSNRRVAAEAGVALGSLTYHFPSQTRLLHDTLLRYVEREVARLRAIAAELRAADSGAEQVAAAVEQLLAGDPARPGDVAELELHLQASRAPELQEASARCFVAYEDFAAAALETLGVPDPERHAPTVVALMVGLTTRRLGTGARDAAGTADALMTIVHGAHARG